MENNDLFTMGQHNTEYKSKTINLRKMPKHLKYSLFIKDPRVKAIRTKEFAVVYFACDDLRDKGNKLYRKKEYKAALIHYYYTYSLLKWIRLKEETQSGIKYPLTDDDITVCKATVDEQDGFERSSFKICIIGTLKAMSLTYMKLRHFTEAVECLKECLTYNDQAPDTYYRLSQVRTYNKNSTEEDLELANKHIEKARSMKIDKIYDDHLKLVNELIEKRKEDEATRVKGKNCDN